MGQSNVYALPCGCCAAWSALQPGGRGGCDTRGGHKSHRQDAVGHQSLQVCRQPQLAVVLRCEDRAWLRCWLLGEASALGWYAEKLIAGSQPNLFNWTVLQETISSCEHLHRPLQHKCEQLSSKTSASTTCICFALLYTSHHGTGWSSDCTAATLTVLLTPVSRIAAFTWAHAPEERFPLSATSSLAAQQAASRTVEDDVAAALAGAGGGDGGDAQANQSPATEAGPGTSETVGQGPRATARPSSSGGLGCVGRVDLQEGKGRGTVQSVAARPEPVQEVAEGCSPLPSETVSEAINKEGGASVTGNRASAPHEALLAEGGDR